MFDLAHSFFRKSTGRVRRAPAHPRAGWLGVESLEDRTLPSASLVAAYSFNEGTGLTVADNSGNGNTGTISNAAWTSAGRFGNALYFNGANSLVTVPGSASVNLTAGMTLEAWVEPTSLSGVRNVLSKEWSGGLSYGLYATNSSALGSPDSAKVYTAGGAQTVTGASLPLNSWSFLAATYDGSWLRLYVNGQQVSKQKASGNMLEPGGALRVGGNSVWGQYFSGMIDNVRVYNGALSQAQLRSDMSTPISSSPLTANAGPSESGNEGAAIGFAGSVTGGTAPFTYSWSFGDGGTASGALTPSHVYATDGSYTATFTVTDGSGHTSQSSTAVTVGEVTPTASAGGPYSGTAGTAISFSGTATDGPTDLAGMQYVWNFGDGVTATGQSPSHTYTAAGTYAATLTVTDPDGLSASASAAVTVTAAPPVASAGPNESGPEGGAITFAGSVTGGQAPLSYSWAFGDGGTAAGTLTPSHTYQEAGTYTAALTVTDGLGRSSTSSDTVTVSEVTPTASAGGPYSGAPGTAIAFSGSATDSPVDLPGMQYAWSFGDGSSSALQSPSHTYAAAGTYAVTLTVTDPDGLTASTSTTATVTSGTQVVWVDDSTPAGATLNGSWNWVSSNPSPFSGSFADQISPAAGTHQDYFGGATQTLNVSSGDTLFAYVYLNPASPPQEIMLQWNVGGSWEHRAYWGSDQITWGTDGTASRSYMGALPAAGQWVRLEVPASVVGLEGSSVNGLAFTLYGGSATWDYAGKATSSTAPSGPPVASAGPNESGPEGAAITFAGSVTGGQAPLSYSWAFGDGGTAAGTLTPTHVYQEAGTYTATLTVTDGLGRSSQSSDTVTVSEVTPTASAGGPYSGAPGTAISFSGSAADSPVDLAGMQYAWSFGDGATGTGQNPSHAYAAAGTYAVTLAVTDPDGLSATASTTATVGASLSPTNEPLLYQSNVQYVGAFRVPSISAYSFGGTALAFNPANHSLFLVGQGNAVSELAIPSTIVNSSNLNDLTTGTVLQQPVAVLSKLPSDPLTALGNGEAIGGLMVVNGQLVGTDYVYYDATDAAAVSHFVLSSLNLSAATVQGLYQVGTLGGGYVGGYMASVPSEWQAALGAPYLTGQADIPIASRTSEGPAAFGFDPGTLSYTSAAPATPYVYYPVSNPLGAYTGSVDPLESGTAQVKGAVFVPGTSSVLFFGSTGTNYTGYGLPQEYGDGGNGDKGPHSLNGQYTFQVWAYNANDFAAVKQGAMQPGQVQPYDVWNFTLPDTGSTSRIGGVAFDPSTGRIYVSVLGAGSTDPYSSLPLIEVFQVTMNQPGAAGLPAPQVGTLAATPSTLAPGPVTAGTPVTLTAGNVYATTGNASVTQVAFYLDSNNDGTLEAGTDRLLGYGTPSTLANAGHNWALTTSTTGLSAGTYRIFAQATDSNGSVSAPVATTFAVTPLAVTAVTPANGLTNVSLTTSVSVTFSEAVDPTTLNASTIELLDPSGNEVAATLTYNSATNSVTLTPTNPLTGLTTYDLLVLGGFGSNVVKDLSGNSVAYFTESFTTT